MRHRTGFTHRSGLVLLALVAEIPIQVSAAAPGRVLVYAVNARSGSTEPLSSVEVNLLP